MEGKRKLDERKWMEERGFENIGATDDFTMPKWMDCAWRRVPCGQDECIKILEKSFVELSTIGSPEGGRLRRCLIRLHELEEPILSV